jgi:hypothetical protein
MCAPSGLCSAYETRYVLASLHRAAHTVRLSFLTPDKELALGERWRTNICAELYNVLNHATFDLPGHVLGGVDFGSVLAARAPRTVQLGLRVSF